MAIFEKNISQNNKTAGAGVLDGPFAWGSEPKRAYYTVSNSRHSAHVIIKTQDVWWVYRALNPNARFMQHDAQHTIRAL